ncbi:hypothetical protein BDW67DRAFT_156938 [Aspergillus spinulosporus]
MIHSDPYICGSVHAAARGLARQSDTDTVDSAAVSHAFTGDTYCECGLHGSQTLHRVYNNHSKLYLDPLLLVSTSIGMCIVCTGPTVRLVSMALFGRLDRRSLQPLDLPRREQTEVILRPAEPADQQGGVAPCHALYRQVPVGSIFLRKGLDLTSKVQKARRIYNEADLHCFIIIPPKKCTV